MEQERKQVTLYSPALLSSFRDAGVEDGQINDFLGMRRVIVEPDQYTKIPENYETFKRLITETSDALNDALSDIFMTEATNKTTVFQSTFQETEGQMPKDRECVYRVGFGSLETNGAVIVSLIQSMSIRKTKILVGHYGSVGKIHGELGYYESHRVLGGESKTESVNKALEVKFFGKVLNKDA